MEMLKNMDIPALSALSSGNSTPGHNWSQKEAQIFFFWVCEHACIIFKQL